MGSDVTRLWQKQEMPAPKTALPALQNFGKVKNSNPDQKSAIQIIFFLGSSMLRCMEKGFSDHDIQKNFRLRVPMPLRPSGLRVIVD